MLEGFHVNCEWIAESEFVVSLLRFNRARMLHVGVVHRRIRIKRSSDPDEVVFRCRFGCLLYCLRMYYSMYILLHVFLECRLIHTYANYVLEPIRHALLHCGF